MFLTACFMICPPNFSCASMRRTPRAAVARARLRAFAARVSGPAMPGYVFGLFLFLAWRAFLLASRTRVDS